MLASYLAMYAAAPIAVPKDAIARPSASAKAVRSSRILFEGRGISVSDSLRIILEMIACSRVGVPHGGRRPRAVGTLLYLTPLNQLRGKSASLINNVQARKCAPVANVEKQTIGA